MDILRVFRDLPGGPVVKNPSCNAGDAGLIPGQETKIPHAVGQLSPHAPQLESPQPATNKAARSAALMPQLERSPHTTTKSRRTATKDPACCS